MADSQNRDVVFSLEDLEVIPSNSGKNYLMAIGVDAYKDPQLPNLKNAERDAYRIVETLSKRYLFEEENIKTLYNAEATRENIMGKLDEISDNITADDNLLFYFSGHGYFRKKGTSGIGYLVPSDAEVGDYSSLLPNSTVLDYLSLIDACHILLVVDSCYSGSLITKMRDVPCFDRKREGIATYAKRVGTLRSRMGLAAGRIETVSDGIGEHSPFTSSLIDVLERNTHTHYPASEFFQTVKTTTTIRAEQTPISGVLSKSLHDGGEFIFQLRPDEPQDWDKAKTENSLLAYQRYTLLYPEGKNREEACWRIAQLKDKMSAYREYMKDYPSGTHYREAIDSMAICEERSKFQQAMKKGEAALRAFLFDYPKGKFAPEAKDEIERIINEEQEPEMWRQALKGGKSEIQNYLAQFPNGDHANDAKRRLELYQKQAEQKAKLEMEDKKAEQNKSVEKPKDQIAKSVLAKEDKPQTKIPVIEQQSSQPVAQNFIEQSSSKSTASIQKNDLKMYMMMAIPFIIIFIAIMVMANS